MRYEDLYDYQKEAIVQMDLFNKGIVCLPTGTGKTIIQAAFISMRIDKNDGFSIYVINAPRIMLSYQLLREIYNYLTINGKEAKYCCVHSGGQSDMEDLDRIRNTANLDLETPIPYSDILSGTSVNVVTETINKARELNVPAIFFSTYNSAERIQDGLNLTGDQIDTTVNDEAHYLVQERFHDILHILNSKNCYFFTATTIHTPSDMGRGMNNKESYGEILYEMTPIEAIKRGKMVRPRMHYVISKSGGSYNRDDFNKSLGRIIKESFEQHQHCMESLSSSKILVSVKGVDDMRRFIESPEYLEMIGNGIKIYSIASDDRIGNNINGKKTTRQKFLKELKIDGKNDSLNMVVLHYDILAEGIDVSGFTGIMPLRNLNKSKFLQTYGRAARLHPDDRRDLENGVMKPRNLKKFRKPYAWVIIPTILSEDLDNRENIGNLIHELRTYGFSPKEDLTVTDSINGLKKTEGPEALNELNTKARQMGLFIEEVEASYESKREAQLEAERRSKLNSLSPIERIRMVQNRLF